MSADKPSILEKLVNISRGNNTSQPEEALPDDSFLYAVVIGLLYAFIMVFLIKANLHPSRSLLAELEAEEFNCSLNDTKSKETYNDEEADVNLNTRIPFEYQSYFRHNGHYPLDELDFLLWLKTTKSHAQ
ncbi:hypothetical protein CHUAL_000941 [Chamberlinius hualienensis]